MDISNNVTLPMIRIQFLHPLNFLLMSCIHEIKRLVEADLRFFKIVVVGLVIDLEVMDRALFRKFCSFKRKRNFVEAQEINRASSFKKSFHFYLDNV